MYHLRIGYVFRDMGGFGWVGIRVDSGGWMVKVLAFCGCSLVI